MFENLEERKNNNIPDGQKSTSANVGMPVAPAEDLSQRIERLHREGAEKDGKKGLIIGIIAFLLIAGGATAGYLFWPEISGVLGIDGGKLTKIEEEGVCQDDTNTCPDGSTVKRIQPNCEFAACPAGGMPCGKEGEKIDLTVEGASDLKCCEDLKTVPASYFDEETKECKTENDQQTICANCGNGECGLGENQCNCPEDCKEEMDTSGWRIYRNEEYGFEISLPSKWENAIIEQTHDDYYGGGESFDIKLKLELSGKLMDSSICSIVVYSKVGWQQFQEADTTNKPIFLKEKGDLTYGYVCGHEDYGYLGFDEYNNARDTGDFDAINSGKILSPFLEFRKLILPTFKFTDKNEISDLIAPKEVYQKYLDAVENRDFSAIKSLSVEDRDFEGITAEKEELFFELLKNMQAVEIRMVDEIIEGDRAVVVAQGKSNPSMSKNLEIKDASSYGIILFKKDGGGWKISNENWTDTSAQVNMESITKGKGFSYWDVGHHCNSTKDESQCASYKTDNEQSRCYSCFGEFKSDLFLCEKATIAFDKEKCYMEIAKINRDQALCDKITDANLKKMCDSAIETASYLSSTNIYTLDFDKDGLNFISEIKFATDIDNSDTDGDSYKDGDEVKNGYNPAGTGKLY